MHTIISDKPANKGEENVLKRAALLRDVNWTPVKALPALYAEKAEGKSEMLHVHLPAWRPQTGVNYSATRYKEKYVGTNVSLETWLSALSFPESAMYGTNLQGMNKLSSAFYGTVCSQYVSYCLGFPFQIDCQQFPYLEGMHEVEKDFDALKLCDILNNDTRHTAIVTGVDRYEDGTVAYVTVSEATPPHVISGIFTREVFIKHWFEDNFHVLRYDRVKDVPYGTEPFFSDPNTELPVINRSLLPDYGQKANYLLGESVVFTVFDGSSVTVQENGVTAAILPVKNGSAVFTPTHAGLYNAATEANEPVAFAVTDAHVTLEKDAFSPGEKLEPTFNNAAADRFLGYVVKNTDFAKVWGYPAPTTGVETPVKVLAPGSYLIIAEYENAYGRYASHPCFFSVKET